MSVKIYNGYKLPDMSLRELHEFTQTFRKHIRGLSKKLVKERMGNMCMGYIDFVRLPDDRKFLFDDMSKHFRNEKNYQQSPLFTAYQKMQENEQRIIAEKIKKPEYDFLCDIIFFPVKGKILAMLFAEQKSYVEAFRQIPGVKEYRYWDNTDQPEDVTPKEWKERKEDWEQAFSYTRVPSLDGLSASCYIQMPFITPEDLHEYINSRFSMDVRTNNYASRIVILRKYKELIKASDSIFGTQDMYKEATYFLKTKEGTKQYQEEVSFLETVFKSEITEDDLTNPLSLMMD
ncbi:hypothetical protein P8918_12525 [Bacillus spizizenii]|nr:hypothetical protein [Bacillus spizizenii]MCY8890395.1 hypothetical protein [Bacillus spizizenii]MEC0841850.1 hypothetical protein [Bacillus spizizenii]